MLVSAFAALVGYGGSPRVSIYMGKKDNETAEKILGNCFAMQIIISAILTAVLLIWSRDLLMLFGASRKSIEYAVSYMNIYAVGTIFVELTLWHECVYYSARIRKDGNVVCIDRCDFQYHT